jgi:hypothetical protein
VDTFIGSSIRSDLVFSEESLDNVLWRSKPVSQTKGLHIWLSLWRSISIRFMQLILYHGDCPWAALQDSRLGVSW